MGTAILTFATWVQVAGEVRRQVEAGKASLEQGDARQALWRCDNACRAVSPSPEPALLLKCAFMPWQMAP